MEANKRAEGHHPPLHFQVHHLVDNCMSCTNCVTKPEITCDFFFFLFRNSRFIAKLGGRHEECVDVCLHVPAPKWSRLGQLEATRPLPLILLAARLYGIQFPLNNVCSRFGYCAMWRGNEVCHGLAERQQCM